MRPKDIILIATAVATGMLAACEALEEIKHES
jgi:hypothetical protein